jgi:hypothetical protein
MRINAQGKPHKINLRIVFKDNPPPLDAVNEQLAETSIKVKQTYETVDPTREPCVRFLLPHIRGLKGDYHAAMAYYDMLYEMDNATTQNALCTLHGKGLVGDTILNTVSRFSTAMEDNNLATAQTLVFGGTPTPKAIVAAGEETQKKPFGEKPSLFKKFFGKS